MLRNDLRFFRQPHSGSGGGKFEFELVALALANEGAAT